MCKIYILGKRYIVANFKGSNSSPVFTNKGHELIVTVADDLGSQLYLIYNHPFNKSTKRQVILHNFSSINTEADINAHNDIIFTSNHNGNPQIFLSNIIGLNPQLLTVNSGNHNTTARFSHKGNKIVFISKDDNDRLKTYVMDLNTQIIYPVSYDSSYKDIAPSFSPNDQLVLFSSANKMYITSILGHKQTLLKRINYTRIIDQRWSN